MKKKHVSPLLEKAINALPFQTQRNFRTALKPHLLTSETYVPIKYNRLKYEPKKNLMKNKLVEFQNKFRQKKLLISQLSKETNVFSKGYKGISIEKDINKKIQRDQILYNHLIKKYKEQGYDTNKLFNNKNKNLFKQSIFLEKNEKYKYILNLVGNEEGNQLEEYLEKVDSILKGTNKIRSYNLTTTIKFKEQDEEEENYNEKINNLKNDIQLTKRTIDDMNLNYDSDGKTISIFNRTGSDYNNIISSTRTSYFDVNFLTKSKFNSTQETNFTNFHRKTNSYGTNINFNYNINKLINEKDEEKEEEKTEEKKEEEKSLKKSKSNFFKKSRNRNSMIMINKHQILSFPQNCFRRSSMNKKNNDIHYKDISTRMNKKLKTILDKQKEVDLNNLYEEVKKKTFEESENEIIDYLKKYKKKMPERTKYNIIYLFFLVQWKEQIYMVIQRDLNKML